MIFSLFRNGKETVNPEYFRAEVTEECANALLHFIKIEIWARFIQRHLDYGGTIKDAKLNFIAEAQAMGFSVQPIDY